MAGPQFPFSCTWKPCWPLGRPVTAILTETPVLPSETAAVPIFSPTPLSEMRFTLLGDGNARHNDKSCSRYRNNRQGAHGWPREGVPTETCNHRKRFLLDTPLLPDNLRQDLKKRERRHLKGIRHRPTPHTQGPTRIRASSRPSASIRCSSKSLQSTASMKSAKSVRKRTDHPLG